jgi:hypothetical protein
MICDGHTVSVLALSARSGCSNQPQALEVGHCTAEHLHACAREDLARTRLADRQHDGVRGWIYGVNCGAVERVRTSYRLGAGEIRDEAACSLLGLVGFPKPGVPIATMENAR